MISAYSRASGGVSEGDLEGDGASGRADLKADPEPSPWLTVPQIAERWQYSVQTVRRMCNRGRLPVRRDPDSPFSHRRVHVDDARRVLGLPRSESEKGKLIGAVGATKPIFGYCRVSSAKQAKQFHLKSKDSDLARQCQKVKEWCIQNHGVEPRMWSDCGSGMSFNRKGLEAMMKAMLSGGLDGGILVATFPDRIARWGTELVELVAKSRGIKIVYIEKEENITADEMSEIASSIIAILTHMSAKMHGRRSAKTCSAPLSQETIEAALRMKKEGFKSSQAAKILAKQGHRNAKGRLVNHYSIQALWDKAGSNLDGLLGDDIPENSFETWASVNLVADPNAKGHIMAFYKLYKEWCEGQGKTPITWRAAQMWIADHFKFEAVKEHRTYQVRLREG